MNVVLPTYNRLDYLKRSTNSLLDSEMTEEDFVWVYDDASFEEGVKDFLLKNESDKFKVSFNEKNLGCDLNVYESIKKTFQSTTEDFVVVTDPDAIYNSQWLEFIKQKLSTHKNIGLLSVFNTENHLEVEPHKDSELCIKESVGGLAVAVNRKIFERVNPNIVLPYHKNFCWDWQCVALCRDLRYDIVCSRDSYVDHIGFIGVHSRSEKTADRAQNFLGANRSESFEDFIL